MSLLISAFVLPACIVVAECSWVLFGFCFFLTPSCFQGPPVLCNNEEHGHLSKQLAAKRRSQSHDDCQLFHGSPEVFSESKLGSLHHNLRFTDAKSNQQRDGVFIIHKHGFYFSFPLKSIAELQFLIKDFMWRLKIFIVLVFPNLECGDSLCRQLCCSFCSVIYYYFFLLVFMMTWLIQNP